MNDNKIIRIAFISTIVLSTLLVSNSFAADDPLNKNKPKLILQITVDQLRGDLPTRFLDRLGQGGFRYLLENGAHYANAHYRHANTETAVGHATLFTGADPSRHGLVSNDWIDQSTGESVYNTEDDRHHLIGKDPKPREGVSPRNLLSSTIGDELVVANAVFVNKVVASIGHAALRACPFSA